MERSSEEEESEKKFHRNAANQQVEKRDKPEIPPATVEHFRRDMQRDSLTSSQCLPVKLVVEA